MELYYRATRILGLTIFGRLLGLVPITFATRRRHQPESSSRSPVVTDYLARGLARAPSQFNTKRRRFWCESEKGPKKLHPWVVPAYREDTRGKPEKPKHLYRLDRLFSHFHLHLLGVQEAQEDTETAAL